MNEGIRSKIDAIEEKITDFVDDHPLTVSFGMITTYILVIIGAFGVEIRKQNIKKNLIKTTAESNELLKRLIEGR